MTRRTWHSALGAALLVALAITLLAQQSPAPQSTPAATRKVRINFLPPPLEGTLSLGIYDGRGKLVRVLHREADLDEFEIGSDSLSTTWDGKDSDGAAVPAGKYHARGYAVGDIDVEGVGYHFNDWVSADGTRRLERIHALEVDEGRLLLSAKLSGAGTQVIVCDLQGNIVDTRENPLKESGLCDTDGFAGIVEPVECRPGAARSKWVVDRVVAGAAQTEVKQFTADGELARRLSVPADEPQPRKLAIAGDDRIYLLEENERTQRLRCLTLARTGSDAGQAVSDWNVEFDKKIVAHDNFTIEDGKPVTSGRGSGGNEKVKVRLKPNALQDDKSTDVELIVAFDATGAVLKTEDGLPLQTISETSGLKRVVLAKGGEKSLNVFQDDGAVVEQFRIGNLDQMMAFDAGEFELK
jgi:hypothetical protein